jgi:hypothetical protein
LLFSLLLFLFLSSFLRVEVVCKSNVCRTILLHCSVYSSLLRLIDCGRMFLCKFQY